MASTVLEQTRALHEDIEILEKTMYGELGDVAAAKKPKAARRRVVGEHREFLTRAPEIPDCEGMTAEELEAEKGPCVMLTGRQAVSHSVRNGVTNPKFSAGIRYEGPIYDVGFARAAAGTAPRFGGIRKGVCRPARRKWQRAKKDASARTA